MLSFVDNEQDIKDETRDPAPIEKPQKIDEKIKPKEAEPVSTEKTGSPNEKASTEKESTPEPVRNKAGAVVPKVDTALRSKIVKVPEVIRECTGIIIKGRKIKSVLFSTDVAIIRNTNADAIIAVYPFTPELSITKAILDVATAPVFCGVGGGTTTGRRSIDIAFNAESFGAYAVVLNSPTAPEIFTRMKGTVDIPIIATISSLNVDFMEKVNAGASIVNVSGGKDTAEIVRKIRKELGEEFPILATGGPTDESIMETIEAGANAISYTPPSNGEIFSEIMKKYREEQ